MIPVYFILKIMLGALNCTNSDLIGNFITVWICSVKYFDDVIKEPFCIVLCLPTLLSESLYLIKL